MALDMKIDQCKRDIDEFRNRIIELRGDPDDPNQPLSEAVSKVNYTAPKLALQARRTLKGHFGKIYALHWASDSRNLVSASQDGKLILWNGFSSHKFHVIPLRSSWVMACAYAPSGQFVACGGLDNVCSVYRVPANGSGAGNNAHVAPNKTHCELAQHEGYLSCCRFISDEEMITSSGDSTCILWDIPRKTPKAIFNDHGGDVMSVSIQDQRGIFVSGSVDATAKVWDYRAKQACVQTFPGHESDINSVSFFPDGNAFGTGSDDSSCRLFDVRAYRQVNRYSSDKILCGITSVAFSKTGSMLFAGYDDYNCYVWDTLSGNIVSTLSGHENRVSCLGMNNDGKALCTGSWDTLLRIWS